MVDVYELFAFYKQSLSFKSRVLKGGYKSKVIDLFAALAVMFGITAVISQVLSLFLKEGGECRDIIFFVCLGIAILFEIVFMILTPYYIRRAILKDDILKTNIYDDKTKRWSKSKFRLLALKELKGYLISNDFNFDKFDILEKQLEGEAKLKRKMMYAFWGVLASTIIQGLPLNSSIFILKFIFLSFLVALIALMYEWISNNYVFTEYAKYKDLIDMLRTLQTSNSLGQKSE